MKPHYRAIIEGAAITLAGITAVSALLALIWYGQITEFGSSDKPMSKRAVETVGWITNHIK